jgi:hypothetical protein
MEFSILKVKCHNVELEFSFRHLENALSSVISDDAQIFPDNFTVISEKDLAGDR